MVEMVQTALRDVDLSLEQVSAFKAALARQVRELTACLRVEAARRASIWTRRACGMAWGTTARALDHHAP